MMLYTKSHQKYQLRQEQIQPWNVEESTMLNLIMDSAEIKNKNPKNYITHPSQQQKNIPFAPSIDPYSHNFSHNLRKYQRKKVDQYLSKHDTNFIERNIKGVSQDSLFIEQTNGGDLSNKLQDKQKRSKAYENEFSSSTIEPINWSLLMYYEQNKLQRRHRHKDIQSFLRFQSINAERRTKKKETSQEGIEPQGDKYQKLLKLRQGLRKRNLKTASESRKTIQNSLNIEQSNRSASKGRKYESFNKTLIRSIPKTSQSVRKAANPIKIQNLNDSPPSSPTKSKKFDDNLIYTSHRNRFSNARRTNNENRMQ